MPQVPFHLDELFLLQDISSVGTGTLAFGNCFTSVPRHVLGFEKVKIKEIKEERKKKRRTCRILRKRKGRGGRKKVGDNKEVVSALANSWKHWLRYLYTNLEIVQNNQVSM